MPHEIVLTSLPMFPKKRDLPYPVIANIPMFSVNLSTSSESDDLSLSSEVVIDVCCETPEDGSSRVRVMFSDCCKVSG